MKPGTLLSKILRNFADQKNCNCSDRAKIMDEWGWRGCWKNRKIITWWLLEELAYRISSWARRRAIGIDL
jgi:hypothetical protein